ncbi:MAG: hypothetical protein U5K75_02040 [Ahrensia sp.]|nr:hypothetical protein [Ahrensia sp.]
MACSASLWRTACSRARSAAGRLAGVGSQVDFDLDCGAEFFRQSGAQFVADTGEQGFLAFR